MAPHHHIDARLPGRLVVLGCGSIGRAVCRASCATSTCRLTDRDRHRRRARSRGRRALRHGVRQAPLTREKLPADSGAALRPGDSCSTSRSTSPARGADRAVPRTGALYLDTWSSPGRRLPDPASRRSQRSNYALREAMLACARARARTEAVIRAGCEPGPGLPAGQAGGWSMSLGTSAAVSGARGIAAAGRAVRDLGVKAIHRGARHPGEAGREARGRVRQHVVDGRFRRRGVPAGRARLGHARAPLPAGWRGGTSAAAAPRSTQAARRRMRGRTWTPLEGSMTVSSSPIARRSRSRILDVERTTRCRYRPTSHYAYHPCDAACSPSHEWRAAAGSAGAAPAIVEEIAGAWTSSVRC